MKNIYKEYLLSLLVLFIYTSAYTQSQCSDGIDNDGDGLTDWQYDLGCYDSTDNTERGAYSYSYLTGPLPVIELGPFNTKTEHGWTTIDPANDTRIIYVSSSAGNDTNNGLTPNTAVKTIDKGYSLLRDSMPDWLLLKRGDSWVGENLGPASGWWNKNGRSLSEKIITASYGSSMQRPVIIDGAWKNRQTSPELNYIAIMGIKFYARKHDPGSSFYIPKQGGFSAFDRLKPGKGFLLEDIHCSYSAIVCDIYSSLSNMTIRRCVVTDSYSDTSSHCQGTYLHNLKDSCLIEETIYDANGWYAPDGEAGIGITSWFNHNFYFKEAQGLVYRNNVNTRPSGHGLKISSDHYHAFKDFIIDNNLFIGGGGALGLNQSGGIMDSAAAHYNFILKNNVVTKIGRTYIKNNADRASGFVIITAERGTVSKNYFVHKDFTLAHDGVINVGNNKGWINKDLTISDNIIFDWFDPNLPGKLNGTLVNVNFSNNILNADSNFVDTARSVETYHAYLGRPASVDSFIMESRTQSRFNWRDEYTAQKVNCYIKAGFCKQSELARAGFTYYFNGLQVAFIDTSKNMDLSNTCFVPIKWLFGNGDSSTVQNPVYTFSGPGTYQVIQIVGNACGQDTVTQTIVVTAIEKISSDKKLFLFPNPTNGSLKIFSEMGSPQSVELTIYNTLGKLVHKEFVQSGSTLKHEMNMEEMDMAKGVYLLKIESDKVNSSEYFLFY